MNFHTSTLSIYNHVFTSIGVQNKPLLLENTNNLKTTLFSYTEFNILQNRNTWFEAKLQIKLVLCFVDNCC